jgi:Clp protease
MDFGNMDDASQPQLNRVPSSQPAQAANKGSGWRIFWGIITGLSMLGNVMLFLMLIGVAVVAFAGRGGNKYTEEVIEDGPRNAKIAIVSIDGIIDEKQAQEVYWQLKEARQDKNVKGVIIRVDSPGGTISGSDQIHNEITAPIPISRRSPLCRVSPLRAATILRLPATKLSPNPRQSPAQSA